MSEPLNTLLDPLADRYVTLKKRDPAWRCRPEGSAFIPGDPELLKLEAKICRHLERYLECLLQKQYRLSDTERLAEVANEARLGIVTAIRSFDSQKFPDVKFLTWATIHILRAGRTEQRRNSDEPAYILDLRLRKRHFEEQWFAEHGSLPDDAIIRTYLGASEATYRQVLQQTISYDRYRVREPGAAYAPDLFHREVVDAITKMPEPQRSLMELVLFEEMSTLEAGLILDIDPQLARTLAARGKKLLAQRLTDPRENGE